ncbi:MAG: DUF3795 domain-containing protein [Thermoleophilia bacterium]|nr:DUF3795 domain-containing protein [Thermoleophilia bacterium]
MERELTYQEVVERLAPCGIDCERCAMYAHGRIRNHAVGLTDALTGFENMAARVVDRFPALREYDRFTEILALFAGAGCTGCRAGGAQLPFCAARTCFRDKEVDFCFQCEEYPCERNAFPENLASRWREYNDRMREIGVEGFYEESLERPRY